MGIAEHSDMTTIDLQNNPVLIRRLNLLKAHPGNGCALGEFFRDLGLRFGGVHDPRTCKSFVLLTEPKLTIVPNLYGAERLMYLFCAFDLVQKAIIQLELGSEAFKAILRDCRQVDSWIGLEVELVRYPGKTKKKEVATTRMVEVDPVWAMAALASNYGSEVFPELDLPQSLMKELGFKNK